MPEGPLEQREVEVKVDEGAAAVAVESMEPAEASLNGPSLELEQGQERFWRLAVAKRAGRMAVAHRAAQSGH